MLSFYKVNPRLSEDEQIEVVNRFLRSADPFDEEGDPRDEVMDGEVRLTVGGRSLSVWMCPAVWDAVTTFCDNVKAEIRQEY